MVHQYIINKLERNEKFNFPCVNLYFIHKLHIQ
jgi:hypothetical protein